MNIRRLTRDALLAGIALILFIVEAQLPPLTPIPGIKAGLANIITVFAVFALGPADVAAILAVRILLSALVSGSLSMLMYSAAGGLMCYAAMLGLKRVLTMKQIWVASVLGAAAHNTGQIAVAIAVTRTPALISYLPVLLVSGMVAGLFTGLCAQFLIAKMPPILPQRKEGAS